MCYDFATRALNKIISKKEFMCLHICAHAYSKQTREYKKLMLILVFNVYIVLVFRIIYIDWLKTRNGIICISHTHTYSCTLAVSMEKSSVNKMVVVGGIAAVAAGGYYGVKFYKERQELLVQEFAQTMMLYWGDRKNSKETIKEYKNKIGPIINMFHK